jgi:transcriptional regulator with XRE-family HTH domain
MTSLKKLLAHNMKEQRHILGISQAVLAERIDTSTHYIAMIELERKTPSLLMLERIAMDLQIDPPELFSMRSIPSKSIKSMQKTVMEDIEKAVNRVINEHLKTIEDSSECPGKQPENPCLAN